MPPTLVLNPASLNLVRPELALLIKQAQGELDTALQPGATHDLAPARAMLAQADGVLRLIELGDAALLARELAALLETISGADARAAQTATRAFFVLNRYLDYLAGRRHAVPELLIGEINAVRAQLRRPPLGDGHFAALSLPREVHCPMPARARSAADAGLLRRLRHMYQVGLLGMLKGRSDPVHLRLMQRPVERAMKLAGGGAGADFWWLLDAVLEGFARGDLRNSGARGRLLSRADRQFKDFLQAAPIEPALRDDLLYLVGKCGGPRACMVRADVGLGEGVASDEQIAEEQSLLMGTSADSVDSMVRVLRGDLRKVKDELEQAAGSGELRAGAVDEMRATLERVALVLREGGLRSSAAMLDTQLERMTAALASGTGIARADLVGIADALVYVETTLSGLARSQGLARGMREQQQGDAASGIAREALDDARVTMLQIAREALESVKRDVTAYVESNHDAGTLGAAVGQIDSVRGALQILEHGPAATVAARSATAMSAAIEHGPRSSAESFAEALADVLICLEYYLAALENGEEPDPLMLKLAEESLGTISAHESA